MNNDNAAIRADLKQAMDDRDRLWLKCNALTRALKASGVETEE